MKCPCLISIVFIILQLGAAIDGQPIRHNGSISQISGNQASPQQQKQSQRVNTSSGQVIKTCSPGQFIRIDCKFFVDCYKGHWRRNFCPSDTFWNANGNRCDHIHNVPECYAFYQPITSKLATATNEKSGENNFQKISSTSTTTTSTTTPPSTTANSFDRHEFNSHSKSSSTYVNKEKIKRANTRTSTDFSSDSKKTLHSKLTKVDSPEEIDSSFSSGNLESSGKEYYDYEEEPDMNISFDGDAEDYDKEQTSSKPKKGRSHDMAVDPGAAIGGTSATSSTAVLKESATKEAFLTTEQNKKLDKISDYAIKQQQSPDIRENELPLNGLPNEQTFGKTCIVRGKQMICTSSLPSKGNHSNMTDSKSNEQNNNRTLTLLSSDKVAKSTKGKQEISPKGSNCTANDGSGGSTYTLQLRLKVDGSVLRLVQAIAYYVNLTIFSLKASKN